MNAMRPAAEPRFAEGRRELLRAGACFIASLPVVAVVGRASAARTDTLRLLCSGPAGSIPNLVTRSIGESMAGVLGQGVIVDNRPGAAGLISVAALKAAPADGTTLLLAQGAIATVYPSLYSKPGYDAAVDLRPVSMASEMAIAFAVGPAVPAEVTDIDGFVAWLRAHSAEANVGSPGTGTVPHLLSAMLFGNGLAWQHVAYAGGPPAVTDLLGGRLAGLALPEGLLRQHHLAGRIRILATSGSTRSASLPDVPTFAERGRPDLVVREWFAFFAPGRTPSPVIASLSGALREAIARPAVSTTLGQAGIHPVWSSAASLAALIAEEQSHWRHVLRTYGIHAD